MSSQPTLDVVVLTAAATRIAAVLSKHAQNFVELAEDRVPAMDQTKLALHANCYAGLFHALGGLSQDAETRKALQMLGLLDSIEAYLRMLQAVGASLLYVPSSTVSRMPPKRQGPSGGLPPGAAA